MSCPHQPISTTLISKHYLSSVALTLPDLLSVSFKEKFKGRSPLKAQNSILSDQENRPQFTIEVFGAFYVIPNCSILCSLFMSSEIGKQPRYVWNRILM